MKTYKEKRGFITRLCEELKFTKGVPGSNVPGTLNRRRRRFLTKKKILHLKLLAAGRFKEAKDLAKKHNF
jgi:hypothetical protein